MKRRDLLKAAVTLPLLPLLMRSGTALAHGAGTLATTLRSRLRPEQPGWPAAAEWEQLKRQVGGRLLKLESPFAHCDPSQPDGACAQALKQLANPFAVGDNPALTQTSGWADAWSSQPSAWAVAAENPADVVAAVNFARKHHLRLVVKGGGHSYQGTSDAPDSLLVWTRHMNQVSLHDAFVPQGCAGHLAPQAAASVQAGAMWIDAYDAVTTRGGRYVQGGGCTTVGVAGLVQSGGFGSFSKRWGTAASNLLEAEIVTADGQVRIANARTNPELFWGLKGGGGGSLGVVTRLTLRTFELPEFFGGVNLTVKADSDAAYRALIAEAVGFYQRALFNPHWGEQMKFYGGHTFEVSMMFQGLSQQQAEQTWAPFLAWVHARKDCHVSKLFQALAAPARHLWDAEFLRKYLPSAIVSDDRPGSPRHHFLWSGDHDQVGWFIQGYQSAWLPASLLQPGRQTPLVDALFEAAQHYGVSLHFNKGLAGAPADAIDRARDTATHPQVLDAFALAISASGGDPAFPGMPGAKPDLAMARRMAAAVDKTMDALRAVAPDAGSYVSESDYFLHDWQRGFWGGNYQRLAAAKRRYDPDGLFFVHHGVGSEEWSADGFNRLLT
ncbi:FAD-binding oxidoreductase [Rhodanobacter denitrificans]|uniref:FAD-binding oxidoreductase n=1 Tax=Rhodanobacter denitrificans TaxID=666685 RepID=A0A368KCJ4_9GAMM|nr:FAD-binding oxidoreductase [Rhodanobacter denitrificans]RCS29642.1 FAD-binding oxidoreductase [Rhodanobacter denitrificans]